MDPVSLCVCVHLKQGELQINHVVLAVPSHRAKKRKVPLIHGEEIDMDISSLE